MNTGKTGIDVPSLSKSDWVPLSAPLTLAITTPFAYSLSEPIHLPGLIFIWKSPGWIYAGLAPNLSDSR